MSRGGTRKARARQEAERRARRRREKAAASSEKKRRRKGEPKGRGRAALLHLSGFAAPFVIAFGLAASGTESSSTASYWAAEIIADPNASYLSEPIGLVYALLVFVVTAAIFAVAPVWLWRRLYRSHEVAKRDWTSVDGTFTIVVVTALAWIVRIVVGYNDAMANLAVIMTILAIYLPVFSALLTIGMPVVPGSGRIGGILPGFVRIPFTERFLLDDADLAELQRFNDAREQEGEKR